MEQISLKKIIYYKWTILVKKKTKLASAEYIKRFIDRRQTHKTNF